MCTTFCFSEVNICLHFFLLLIFFLKSWLYLLTSLKRPLSIPSTTFSVLFPQRRPSQRPPPGVPPPCSGWECGSLSCILPEISLASLMWEPLVSRSLGFIFVCLFILSIFVNTWPSHFLKGDTFLRTSMPERLFIFYPHTHFGVAVLSVKMATVTLPTPLIPTTS